MTKNIFAIFTSIAFLAIGGCSSNGAVEAQEQATMDKPKIQSKTSAYIKPGAAVDLSHNYDGKTDIGEIENFQVTVYERYDAGTLSLNIYADDGLNLSTQAQASFSMKGDKKRVMDLSVSAQTGGKYYLNIQATADVGDGQPEVRMYTIPIQIGDPRFNAKINENIVVEDTADGGKIIVMEAEEIILEPSKNK